MLQAFKERLKKFPAGLYVMAVGFVGIITIISLKQNHEKKRQAVFLTLFSEYEKKATPELLDELLQRSHDSSFLKKRFGAKLLQEVVLFRPDIFTKAWLKEPIKVKDNYDRFSEGSILITENKLEDALANGEKLQEELNLNESPVLFAFNTFRLAILHDKLGHQKQAKDHFESIMTQKSLRETLNKAYKYESVCVSDYIEDRLNHLKP